MEEVALITGGGRGIGRALALSLAANGARVAVAARTSTDLDETVAQIESAGGTAVGFAADVACPDDVGAMVAAVQKELGEVTLLVNNAGVNRAVGPTWEVDPATWWGDVEVNLRGPLLCTREVLPSMIAKRRGRIINIISGTATKPFPFNTSYGCSKTALARLSESLAEETREHGVEVFALEPGLVQTDMAEGVLGSSEGQRYLGGLDEATFVPVENVCDAVLLMATGQLGGLAGRCLFAADDLLALAERSAQIIDRGLYRLSVQRLEQP